MDTWRGLVEQWIAGTQAMPEIVIFVEWAVGLVVLVELPADLVEGECDGTLVPEGVPPPLGAAAPPGDAAELSGAPRSVKPTKQQAKLAVLAASEADRLWTSALAMNYPFCAFCAPGSWLCPTRAFPEPRMVDSGPGEARR